MVAAVLTQLSPRTLRHRGYPAHSHSPNINASMDSSAQTEDTAPESLSQIITTILITAHICMHTCLTHQLIRKHYERHARQVQTIMALRSAFLLISMWSTKWLGTTAAFMGFSQMTRKHTVLFITKAIGATILVCLQCLWRLRWYRGRPRKVRTPAPRKERPPQIMSSEQHWALIQQAREEAGWEEVDWKAVAEW